MKPIGPWRHRIFGLPQLRLDLSASDAARLVLRDSGNIGRDDELLLDCEIFHDERLRRAVTAFNHALWPDHGGELPGPDKGGIQ